ncbi:MAG: hypothetical protein IJ263_03385 [Paludibacteraceae bacterium]|nr:hypothetical protein [Paludibacteraceae bacterium]
MSVGETINVGTNPAIRRQIRRQTFNIGRKRSMSEQIPPYAAIRRQTFNIGRI